MQSPCRSYRFISNTLSQANQLIRNIFAKAVAWTKSWFGLNANNQKFGGQIPSTINPLARNDDVVVENQKGDKDNTDEKRQTILKESPNQPKPLSNSVKNEDKPTFVSHSVPVVYSQFSGLLDELTHNYCRSFSERKNADLHARKFYFIEFENMVREYNLNENQKFKLIVQMGIRRKEIENMISNYVKPKHSNRIDDLKPEYFSQSEVRELTKHLFGINFAYFIVENAPIDKLESLRIYMDIFSDKNIFTEHDSVQILSDILSRLSKCILSSSYKFETLKPQIEFIQNQVNKGIQISKERIEIETLVTDYDSDESEEEESLEEKFDVSAVIRNFNDKNIRVNDIQKSVLDTLRKCAALCRLKEYQSSEFDPVTFLKMLLDAEHFLGEIDASDPLYVPLQEAFDRNTMKYSDRNTVYDMLDVTRIVEPHSRLAKKLGVAPLSGDTVAIIPDVDNDLILSNMCQQEENAASIHADHLLARRLAGY